MPHTPSPETIKKYGLVKFIEEKVTLIHICETELDVLRADPEGARKAREELERTRTCLEGTLPSDPSDAKMFLDRCKELVEKPAQNHIERHMRAGAAFTLVTEMIKDEARFPEHVRFYILHEYSARLDKLYPDEPSEEERMLLSHHDKQWPLEIRPKKKILRFNKIDGNMADALMKDMVAIERKIFYLPSDTKEDAPAFRVAEIIRSAGVPFWGILYDGSGYSIRVDGEELKDLLINSTYAVYDECQ